MDRRRCRAQASEVTTRAVRRRGVFEHRQLRTVTLGAALTLDGFTFPAETELVFGDSGAFSHARSAAILHVLGIPFAAQEEVVFLFGRLHEGWLAEDHEIESVPCQAGEIVRFHENGRRREESWGPCRRT